MWFLEHSENCRTLQSCIWNDWNDFGIFLSFWKKELRHITKKWAKLQYPFFGLVWDKLHIFRGSYQIIKKTVYHQMKSGSLELGTTLGWDRSQMHKSIPKISQLWGGVVLYNLAKKVFGLGLVDYPVSHQTFCLFLCFVPIPSYLTFCPNSFLQLSTFFLLNWSDQVPILQRRIMSIFCEQNLDLSCFLLRSINFVTKKCSHFASRCCLTTK